MDKKTHKVSVVWFKKDLRLQDHECLKRAIENSSLILPIYILEPEYLNDPHTHARHLNFLQQSLMDLKQQLKSNGLELILLQAPALEVFKRICKEFEDWSLFSHQEVGLSYTYKRDLSLQSYLKQQGIKWEDIPHNAVYRPLKDRSEWDQLWKKRVYRESFKVDFSNTKLATTPSSLKPIQIQPKSNPDPLHQEGGELAAGKRLTNYIQSKDYLGYAKNISKPGTSRTHCSRLSPYLSFGNLSIHQAVQALSINQSHSVRALQTRLRWHCHFIQKFESESRIEYENFNPAYNEIRQDWNESYFQAWKNAETGFPLIDACMRCLESTGYINFRMRAMLVSFLTHHLWLDWREGSVVLARRFLDFEPGIHFPQVQMQAATTGIHTIRVYNPVKQALENDSEAEFIKHWLPELRPLPLAYQLEPWKMTPFEALGYGVQLGKHYPLPIVNLQETGNRARDILWSLKNQNKSKKHGREILRKHVRPAEQKNRV